MTSHTQASSLAEKTQNFLIRSRTAIEGLWAGNDDRFPDFLGIGAQKAGTTWLHENLRSHPEIFLHDAKELHFFDLHLGRGLRHYKSLFRSGKGRICGEITPSYGILPADRIRLIHKQNPELRTILLLRNPMQRAWSGAVMELADRRQRSVESVPLAEYETFLRSTGSVARSTYTAMLDRWCAVFPTDQVFVGFFEDIRTRPVELFTEILQHLGVSHTGLDLTKYPLQNVIVPDIERNSKVHKFATAYDSPRRSAAMLPEIQALLNDLYRDEVAQLEERFGARCSNWRSEA